MSTERISTCSIGSDSIRFAISYRNKWMIKRADIVVTYVTHGFGGAVKFKEIAEKQGKMVIELSE